MLITSVGEAKRILIQMFSMNQYLDNQDRLNDMVNAINDKFIFKNSKHKELILEYISYWKIT